MRGDTGGATDAVLRIASRSMLVVVALEVTAAPERPLILESQRAVAVWSYDAEIEVDQMAVADDIALAGVHPVGVVTGGAGRADSHQVALVREAAGVAQQDIAIMALVAQGVLMGCLCSVVRDGVVALEQEAVARAVRP